MEKEILKQWEDLGATLLAKHGLVEKGWKLSINTRKRAVGLCDYQKRTIFLSVHFLEETEIEEIYNVILHEIAHALCPPIRKRGNRGFYWDMHGPEWKKTARSIGCTGDTCTHSAVSTAQANYQLSCESCGRNLGTRYRLKPALINRYVSKCCKAKITATAI